MLSCKDAARLVSESLDRHLGLGQRIALRVHLLMCVLCTRCQGQLLFLRRVLQHYLDNIEEIAPLSSTALPREARQRIKAALRGRRP